MSEQTLVYMQSGGTVQHSAWNQMEDKIQSVTIGHRHDGVGSYGPLTAFSGGTFTNVSTMTLTATSTTLVGGAFTVSGKTTLAALGADNLSTGGTLAVGGNTSFGGVATIASGLNVGVYNAPSNLSSSGIVAGIVAGSNITITPSQGAYAGIVQVNTTPAATLTSGLTLNNVNLSTGNFRVFSLSSGRVYETLNLVNASAVPDISTLPGWALYFDLQGTPIVAVALSPSSGVTNVLTAIYSSGMTVAGNISTGSLYLQSRVSANDAIFTSNLSTNTASFTGSVGIGGQLSAGAIAGTNLSVNSLNVSGSASLQVVTASSLTVQSASVAGNLSVGQINVSSIVTAQGMVITSGWNLSTGGNVQVQSRTLTNDLICTTNFSAGSLVVGSAQFTNFSATTGIIASTQLGYITNQSGFTVSNVNTSVGNFRAIQLSGGRFYWSLNSQNTSGLPDVSGLAGWMEYYDNAAGNTVRQWMVTPTSGVVNTIAYMNSAGFAVNLNLSAGSLVAGSGQFTNISTGSLVVGSAQFTNYSANTAIMGSAQATNLVVLSGGTAVLGSAQIGFLTNLSGIVSNVNVSAGWLSVASAGGGTGIVQEIFVTSAVNIFGQVGVGTDGNVQASTNLSTNQLYLRINPSALGGLGLAPGANTSFGILAVGMAGNQSTLFGSAVIMSGPLSVGTQEILNGPIQLQQITAPSPLTNGQLWNDSTQHGLQFYNNSVKQTIGGILFTAQSTTTVTNVNTSTQSLIPIGFGTNVIPGNTMVPGKVLRATLLGYYTNTSTGVGPVATLSLLYGGTVLASSNQALSVSVTGGSNPWMVNVWVTCFSGGAAGQLAGRYYLPTGANQVSLFPNTLVNQSVTQVNTAVNASFDLQWAFTSTVPTTSVAIVCDTYILEMLN